MKEEWVECVDNEKDGNCGLVIGKKYKVLSWDGKYYELEGVPGVWFLPSRFKKVEPAKTANNNDYVDSLIYSMTGIDFQKPDKPSDCRGCIAYDVNEDSTLCYTCDNLSNYKVENQDFQVGDTCSFVASGQVRGVSKAGNIKFYGDWGVLYIEPEQVVNLKLISRPVKEIEYPINFKHERG